MCLNGLRLTALNGQLQPERTTAPPKVTAVRFSRDLLEEN